jgi:hypothetical protein
MLFTVVVLMRIYCTVLLALFVHGLVAREERLVPPGEGPPVVFLVLDVYKRYVRATQILVGVNFILSILLFLLSTSDTG